MLRDWRHAKVWLITELKRKGYEYGAFQEFDVTPDQQRFLIGTLIGEPNSAHPWTHSNAPDKVWFVEHFPKDYERNDFH